MDAPKTHVCPICAKRVLVVRMPNGSAWLKSHKDSTKQKCHGSHHGIKYSEPATATA